MQILYESLWISSSNCFLTALARGSWEPAFEAAASIKLNFFLKRLKDEKRCRSGDLEEDRYRKPLCKSLDVHQTRKRLVSASKRTNMIIDFELWIVAGFSSPIYFSVKLNSTSDPPPPCQRQKKYHSMFSRSSSNIMFTGGKTWVRRKMQIWFVQGSFEQVFEHARVSRLVLQGPRGVRGRSWPEADWKTAGLLWSHQHPGEDKQGIILQQGRHSENHFYWEKSVLIYI